MADRLGTVRDWLGRATQAVRQRSFWIVLPLAALAVMAVAVVVGSTALGRADAWQTRTAELRATRRTVAEWRRTLVPAAPAESASWARSRRAAGDRGIEPGNRVALMQRVAQRAEELGIGEVSLSFITSDTLEIDAVREVDGALFRPAPWALRVRLRADYPDVASFIGALPPSVDVHRLRITDDDGPDTGGPVAAAPVADLVLTVFLAEGR